MNQKELMIISLLRRNSREKLTSMSKTMSMPVSRVYEKLKSYEKSLIKKHTAILDFSSLGYGARATILLKTSNGTQEKLADFLLSCKSVNTTYRINNGYDFYVEAIFREIGEMERFMDNIESTFQIKQKQVHYITGELKREDFMSHPNYLKLTGAVSNL